jgi:hypothetical protein
LARPSCVGADAAFLARRRHAADIGNAVFRQDRKSASFGRFLTSRLVLDTVYWKFGPKGQI